MNQVLDILRNAEGDQLTPPLIQKSFNGNVARLILGDLSRSCESISAFPSRGESGVSNFVSEL